MKKVTFRASFSILIAIAVLLGLAIYIIQYINHGADWALYFDNSTSNCSYVMTDRNGVPVATMEHGGKYYCSDEGIRKSCYHVVGDYAGNVADGALQNFHRELSGFSLIKGIQERDDVYFTLTIDTELQKLAYKALDGRNGAVLIENYKTGEILCMVSAPSMDPLNPPDPLPDGTYINRCIGAAFTPGSVFKLVTLTAAIETIPDLFQHTFTCTGTLDVKGAPVNCTGIHGEQTVEQALANSCNCAFGQLALELGGDTLEKYAKKLGITEHNKLGDISTAAGFYDGDTPGSPGLAWSGIGQYNDLVCPYAILRIVAAVANEGVLVEPVLHGLSSGETRLMDSDTAINVGAMMSYNVTTKYGTDTFPGLSIAAKTGTAEVGEDKENHAWFAGFLNDSTHPYAFVVLVENGGSGLRVAGAVANTVLQTAVTK